MKRTFVDHIEAIIDIEGCEILVSMNDVFVTINKPRNPRYHRLIRAMCSYVMKNIPKLDDLKDDDDLLFWFKDTYGYYTPLKTNKGEIRRKYKSFSFSEMDETEFLPIAEEIKQYCYAVLNKFNCKKEVVQGLLDIEF